MQLFSSSKCLNGLLKESLFFNKLKSQSAKGIFFLYSLVI